MLDQILADINRVNNGEVINIESFHNCYDVMNISIIKKYFNLLSEDDEVYTRFMKYLQSVQKQLIDTMNYDIVKNLLVSLKDNNKYQNVEYAAIDFQIIIRNAYSSTSLKRRSFDLFKKYDNMPQFCDTLI
jgi:hypothetical protein